MNRLNGASRGLIYDVCDVQSWLSCVWSLALFFSAWTVSITVVVVVSGVAYSELALLATLRTGGLLMVCEELLRELLLDRRMVLDRCVMLCSSTVPTA